VSNKTTIYPVRVEFGHCDPAGIIWYPNFFHWIDAASRHHFEQCGVPTWAETTRTMGVIGTPIVDTKAKFLKTATYGQNLGIHTQIIEWREKSFVLSYVIRRANEDGTVDDIMQCEDVRIFAAKREDGKNGIRAVPIPAEIRALCVQVLAEPNL
jgi:4-hydroxybenzoyl-CoA thioesterase